MSLFRLRGRRPLLAALVALAVLALPSVADAGRRDDERRDLIERQMALVAELDALTASDEELASAIATLDAWVELQQGEVVGLQDELARLMVVASEARVIEAEKQAEVDVLEDQMVEMAVAAYVSPPQADQVQTILSASAPTQVASLGVYLDVQNRRDTDIVRQLREARAALGDQRYRAEEAELRAEIARDAAVRTLESLVLARQQNQYFRNEVRNRIDAAQFESDLIGLDLLRINQQTLDEARSRLGSNRLVSVRGIRVHESVGPQLEALLTAAEADGVSLGGGGFRTTEEQIVLRRAHCGDDPVSIWEKPPGECSPPTAKPGTSLHELGLAIDFTYRGGTISSHASPGFQWLAANAHRFGFHNLPSEPWHWSLDGT